MTLFKKSTILKKGTGQEKGTFSKRAIMEKNNTVPKAECPYGQKSKVDQSTG